MLGLPALIVICIMQFLFQGWVDPPGRIYFEWGWIRVTRYSMHIIALSLLCITGFIFLTSLVTYISGDGRTRFVELHASVVDFVVVALALLLAALLIWSPFPPLREVLASLGITGL
jgi:hypothetical protein